MRKCRWCGEPETVLFQTDWVCLTNGCDKLPDSDRRKGGPIQWYCYDLPGKLGTVESIVFLPVVNSIEVLDNSFVVPSGSMAGYQRYRIIIDATCPSKLTDSSAVPGLFFLNGTIRYVELLS